MTFKDCSSGCESKPTFECSTNEDCNEGTCEDIGNGKMRCECKDTHGGFDCSIGHTAVSSCNADSDCHLNTHGKTACDTNAGTCAASVGGSKFFSNLPKSRASILSFFPYFDYICEKRQPCIIY